MKRSFALPLCGTALLFTVTGCLSPSRTVVTEYGNDGKIVKCTQTSESVISSLVQSTRGKSVIAWESGWAAGLSVAAATAETPTPACRIFAGKTDKGMISALPNQNWADLPQVINATKYDLSVTASGIANGK